MVNGGVSMAAEPLAPKTAVDRFAAQATDTYFRLFALQQLYMSCQAHTCRQSYDQSYYYNKPLACKLSSAV